MRLPTALLAGLRSLRGRCPTCNSEGPSLHGCTTCLGYSGPFPASEESQRRWAARFERSQLAGVRTPAPPSAAELFPVR